MITGTKTEIKKQLQIKDTPLIIGDRKTGERYQIGHAAVDTQLNDISKTSNRSGTIFFYIIKNFDASNIDLEIGTEEVTILPDRPDEIIEENFIDELAKQSEQMEYPKFWLREFDKEVRRLFGEKLPTSYNLNEIDVMLEHTPEEAAAHFFSGYTIL